MTRSATASGQPDLLAEQRRLAVGHVAVGQADAHHAGAAGVAVGERVLEVLEDGGPEPARPDVVLDRHHELVLGREALDELRVERLRERPVGDREMQVVLGEDLGSVVCNLDPVAVPEQGDSLAFLKHLAAADLEARGDARKRHTRGRARG